MVQTVTLRHPPGPPTESSPPAWSLCRTQTPRTMTTLRQTLFLASGLFLLFLATAPAHAQTTFGPQQIITTGANGATSVFASDLDGDGDQDVLSAAWFDDEIAWYENTDGLGSFGPGQTITALVDGVWSVFAADLDGDGDQDVLSASNLDNTIAWYENMDGLGTFGSQQIITTLADGAFSVFAADLDGDGDLDVLSASGDDDKIAWYENLDGQGDFGPQQVITTLADWVQQVFVADLDGDGDQDVLSASDSDDKIAWYENTDGLGDFGPQQVITTLAETARWVFAADLDGDGDQDVLSASSSDDKIAWYENDGLGTFGPQQIITTSADHATSVFAADLDGDGDQDVLSASLNDSKIAWYENGAEPPIPPGWVGDGGGIIEITYDGDAGTCPDPSNPDDYGCTVLPGEGNTVWHDGNLNDDYYVSGGGGTGEIERLSRYIEAAVPDLFEIRFTSDGGVAIYGFGGLEIVSVPFEIWNAGENVDDPSDDIRMIPFLNIDDPVLLVDWADQYTGTDSWFGSPCPGRCAITHWVYFMMPDRSNGYDLFEAAAIGFGGPGAVYDRTSDGDTQIDPDPFLGGDCANQEVYVDFCYRNQDFMNNPGGSKFIYPIGRVVIADLAEDGTTPPEGTTIRFLTEGMVVANEPNLPTGELPQGYALLPVYPNPFNPPAVVPFVVPEAGHVRLTLVDILGREVAILLSRQVAAGSHEAVLDGGHLASGVYLVRLEAEGVVHASQKVLLLR